MIHRCYLPVRGAIPEMNLSDVGFTTGFWMSRLTWAQCSTPYDLSWADSCPVLDVRMAGQVQRMEVTSGVLSRERAVALPSIIGLSSLARAKALTLKPTALWRTAS
jgi:hypothetical protein